MRKNQVLTIILVFIFFVSSFTLFPAQVNAVTVDSGTCGEVNWKLSDRGVLTIYGNGAMDNYKFIDGPPWWENLDKITSVVIENGVTSIGDYSFYRCTNLVSVSIPNSVEYVGNRAFAECSSLNSITLPNSIAIMGNEIFANCSNLKQAVLPDRDGLISLGAYHFYQCVSLEYIVIPDDYVQISYAMFFGCSSLKEITIPDSVRYISQYAFAECVNLKTVVIPNNITRIEAPFDNCTNLNHVLYKGTIEEWNNTAGSQGTSNQLADLNATFHYECTGNEIIDGQCIICTGYCPHKWDDGIVVKKPTHEKKGTKSLTCVACGETKTESIAKLRKISLDNIPWTFLIIFTVVCIGGAAALAIFTTKKKK